MNVHRDDESRCGRIGRAMECGTSSRRGCVTARPDLLEAMLKVHQYFLMCAPTPAQYAALEALRNGEEAVRAMIAEYDRRRRVIVAGLNEVGLPCFEPQGAFYAFPSVSHLGIKVSPRYIGQQRSRLE